MLTFLAMTATRILLTVTLLTSWVHAQAQSAWKPTRPIALIVPNGPAGTSDRTARDLQRLLQKYRLVEMPIIVINRPGGSGTVALNQLHAATGDPHTLLLVSGAIVAAHILGLTPYRHSEFTPIASVAEEYFGMNVRAESPIRTAHAMLEGLRKKPSTLAFGTISVSGINYLSMVMATKLGGVQYRKLRTVTFTSGSESTLALLGGHIDAVNTGLGNMAEHLKAGKIRTLAIGSPSRMPEPFSDVPTWRELNINVVASGWRGVMGARGLTPAQVKFWEIALRRVMETPEWKQDLTDNYWVSNTVDAQEARKRWDAEYLESQSLLTDLGITRAK